MILHFGEKNLHMTFEVTEEASLSLLNFSNAELDYDVEERKKKYYPAMELHITGENQDDHHGAKHTVTSRSNSLKYVNHIQYTNEYGTKLEFILEDDSIQAVLNYQFYDEISAVRTWTTVKNLSDKAVGLEYLSSFTFTGIDAGTKMNANDKMTVYVPHNSWKREGAWQKYTLAELGYDKITTFATKRIAVANTGTWSSKEHLPMGAVENRETNTAIMWQIEHNGSWQWEISDIDDRMYLKLSGPCENENHWYKRLKQGESFESVKVSLAVAQDFDSALSEMTAYRRRIVRKNQADQNLPVIFNDYMNCLWADPTTEKMLPVIDKAAEAGAEIYCMDAGWYADGTWWETVGQWLPCEWRFPNGIKEVFDYIKEKGMIPGIWLEIEVMGINCPIVDQFPDECFFMRHGKKVIDHGRYQLDFRNKKVRHYATSVIDRVVGEYGVGYIKMDYNIDGGIGTEVHADSFGDGLLEHNRAQLSWIKEIMDKYPELIIENCSSGGMRIDYAMLELHPVQSVTDQEDYKNMAVIAANCATGVLPEQAAIWSYPKADGDANEAEYNMINAMLCRMHLSGEIFNLSEKQFAAVKEGVECYKSLRDKIKNFIPFYPVGLNRFDDSWVCVGYKSEKNKYISVWRLGAEEDTFCVKLEENVYGAELVYPSQSNCGIICQNDEVKVTLPEKYSAVIFKV